MTCDAAFIACSQGTHRHCPITHPDVITLAGLKGNKRGAALRQQGVRSGQLSKIANTGDKRGSLNAHWQRARQDSSASQKYGQVVALLPNLLYDSQFGWIFWVEHSQAVAVHGSACHDV